MTQLQNNSLNGEFMKTTKNEIMDVALRMFASSGYEAVSMSMIAGEIGITKGALYRHFESKQDIFDSLIKKMFELDAERAEADKVPEKSFSEDPSSYENTEPEDLCEFAKNQLEFWTMDEFASNFRKMLTLEQFRNSEMSKLYQNVVVSGPVAYTEDLFRQMETLGKLNEEAMKMGPKNLAIMLFAPLRLSIEMADGGENIEELRDSLNMIVDDFKDRWLR